MSTLVKCSPEKARLFRPLAHWVNFLLPDRDWFEAQYPSFLTKWLCKQLGHSKKSSVFGFDSCPSCRRKEPCLRYKEANCARCWAIVKKDVPCLGALDDAGTPFRC